jgi:hypothetical protein
VTYLGVQIVPVVAIEAVTAWLDAGQPDREKATDRRQRDAERDLVGSR